MTCKLVCDRCQKEVDRADDVFPISWLRLGGSFHFCDQCYDAILMVVAVHLDAYKNDHTKRVISLVKGR